MEEDGQAFIGSVFNTLNWAKNGEGQKCKPVKEVTATLVQRQPNCGLLYKFHLWSCI